VESHKNEDEFIKDAVNTLLSARKDLRIAITCELYKREEISISKACEIASLTIEEMKKILHKKGISRHEDASVNELRTIHPSRHRQSNHTHRLETHRKNILLVPGDPAITGRGSGQKTNILHKL